VFLSFYYVWASGPAEKYNNFPQNHTTFFRKILKAGQQTCDKSAVADG
jgi:hypothetical protein